MLRPTPLHSRTQPLCASLAWKSWNGYAAVRAYDEHSEAEYFAIRHKVGVIDVSPLSKHEIVGPDAAVLISRVFSRNVEALEERRVTYGVLVDPHGYVLDDGTCARVGPDHFRLCTNERWPAWLHRHSRGLSVQIEDSTDRIAALAVQGPEASRLLAPLVDFRLEAMPFFRIRPAKLAEISIEISRTGYTGDLGFELWLDPADAGAVWDLLLEAGAAHQVTPFGLDALDVARIEAGFVLCGVDYFGARQAPARHRMSTPHELGLAHCVDLQRDVEFVGQSAVRAELQRGPSWSLVGLALDGEELERLYDGYGLSSHFGPHACRDAVPVYATDGQRQVGQVTSHTWSPTVKAYVGLATVQASHAHEGAAVRVEHTADYERRTVAATVVPRPFFDPPRKRAVVRSR
ncbi:MAG: aminomethyltransferase family protein [Myxococcales bacterium]|nr:aminomethyltransferase family protein [Myxococcales bacterium]